MINRIVKLEFTPENIAPFKHLFKENQAYISSFPGCLGVKLLQHKQEKHIFFTYSYWESEEALANYRQSELFQSVWAKTKILFGGKPYAWSTEEVDLSEIH